MVTPYEKNLEFWRQLWRVIERSDVVIQIVDSRHPLLFRFVVMSISYVSSTFLLLIGALTLSCM